MNCKEPCVRSADMPTVSAAERHLSDVCSLGLAPASRYNDTVTSSKNKVPQCDWSHKATYQTMCHTIPTFERTWPLCAPWSIRITVSKFPCFSMRLRHLCQPVLACRGRGSSAGHLCRGEGWCVCAHRLPSRLLRTCQTIESEFRNRGNLLILSPNAASS